MNRRLIFVALALAISWVAAVALAAWWHPAAPEPVPIFRPAAPPQPAIR